MVLSEKERNMTYLVIFVVLTATVGFFVYNYMNTSKARYAAHSKRCEENVKNLSKALNKYADEHEGKFPEKLSSLVPEYIKEIPTCPTAGVDTYSVSYTSTQDRKSCIVFCKGHFHEQAGKLANQPSVTLISDKNVVTAYTPGPKNSPTPVVTPTDVSGSPTPKTSPTPKASPTPVKKSPKIKLVRIERPFYPYRRRKYVQFLQKNLAHPFVETADENLSAFALDNHCDSYCRALECLENKKLPPKNSIRVEEFVNYFSYGYSRPKEGLFGIDVEGAPSPFGKENSLLRIGIVGAIPKSDGKKNVRLTFIVDCEKSEKIPKYGKLAGKILKMTVDTLGESDEMAVILCKGKPEVLADYTGDKDELGKAIKKLKLTKTSNLEEGVKEGYKKALKSKTDDVVNRVVLLSHGVLNRTEAAPKKLLNLAEKMAEKGVSLSTVGVGMGSRCDILMEEMGDRGMGHYAYVNNGSQAQKIFDANLVNNLKVVARDARVEVDFNPEIVRSYRLIGYAGRLLNGPGEGVKVKDGGEFGAGKQVTALYELKMRPRIQGGKFSVSPVATVYVRYKLPGSDDLVEEKDTFYNNRLRYNLYYASDSFRLAASAAEFAEILKKSRWAKESKIEDVEEFMQRISSSVRSTAQVQELTKMMDMARKSMMPRLE